MAQWIRHRPTEPEIAGSSPAGVILKYIANVPFSSALAVYRGIPWLFVNREIIISYVDRLCAALIVVLVGVLRYACTCCCVAWWLPCSRLDTPLGPTSPSRPSAYIIALGRTVQGFGRRTRMIGYRTSPSNTDRRIFANMLPVMFAKC